MRGREHGSFSRKFLSGKNRVQSMPDVIALLKDAPGIGLVPPEFDDLDGGELETIENFRAEHSPR